MALIHCPECKREISDKAPACPYCGYPLAGGQNQASSDKSKPKDFDLEKFLGNPPPPPQSSLPKSNKKIGCGTILGVLLLLGIISGQLKNCGNNSTKHSPTTSQSQVAPPANLDAILNTMRTSLEAKEYQKVLDEGKKLGTYWSVETKRMEEKARTNFAVLRIAELEKIKGGSEAEKLDRYSELISQYQILIKGEHTPEEEAALKKWKALRNPLREKQLLAQIRKLPASDLQGNLEGYTELASLNPDKKEYRDKRDHYRRTLDRDKALETCDIELLSWHWSTEYGYVTAEGRIKNHSGRRLENVMAYVEYNDKSGNLVTTDSNLIEYNPLMPGQTSPFKVMTSYNPAMQTASIRFRQMFGGELHTAYPEK